MGDGIDLGYMGPIVLSARRSHWGRYVEVMISAFSRVAGITTVYEADPIVMKQVGDESLALERRPTFTMDMTAAQQLMDELWQCGLRPSEGTGSAGALAATQKHLDDMRKLVFREEVKS